MLYAPLDDGLSQQVRLKNGQIAHIRPLVGDADIAACQALQGLTWGTGEHSGLIQHSVLGIMTNVGGLVVGGFVDDILKACLISFAGYDKSGSLIHWSSRLAVHPDYRDSGLGHDMKNHQRLACKEMKVKDIYWTYDPLESRNAHFNINKLGAQVEEYKRDAYGLSASPIHQGIGTDRFLVRWSVKTPCKPRTFELAEIPFFAESLTKQTGSVCKIMIPDNIQKIKENNPEMASEHRSRTRSLFESAFAAGFRVIGFQRDTTENTSYYILKEQL
jgi:predicted GNAT superfamily acetyltransferase